MFFFLIWIFKSSSPLPSEFNNAINININLSSPSPSESTTPITTNNDNDNNDDSNNDNNNCNNIHKSYSPLPSNNNNNNNNKNNNSNILLANSSYITPSRFELKAKELSRRQKWIQAASRRSNINTHMHIHAYILHNVYIFFF